MDEAILAESLSRTLLLLVLVVAVAYPVTVWRLRTYHQSVWQSLGEPRAFGSPLAVSSWRVVGFAMSFKHLRLNDLTLSLACVGFALGLFAASAALIGALMWLFGRG